MFAPFATLLVLDRDLSPHEPIVLDKGRALAPQVEHLFRGCGPIARPGYLIASYACVDGLVFIHDGWTVGVLHEFAPNDGELPRWVQGIGWEWQIRLVDEQQLDVWAVQRRYYVQGGHVCYHA